MIEKGRLTEEEKIVFEIILEICSEVIKNSLHIIDDIYEKIKNRIKKKTISIKGLEYKKLKGIYYYYIITEYNMSTLENWYIHREISEKENNQIDIITVENEEIKKKIDKWGELKYFYALLNLNNKYYNPDFENLFIEWIMRYFSEIEMEENLKVHCVGWEANHQDWNSKSQIGYKLYQDFSDLKLENFKEKMKYLEKIIDERNAHLNNKYLKYYNIYERILSGKTKITDEEKDFAYLIDINTDIMNLKKFPAFLIMCFRFKKDWDFKSVFLKIEDYINSKDKKSLYEHYRKFYKAKNKNDNAR